MFARREKEAEMQSETMVQHAESVIAGIRKPARVQLAERELLAARTDRESAAAALQHFCAEARKRQDGPSVWKRVAALDADLSAADHRVSAARQALHEVRLAVFAPALRDAVSQHRATVASAGLAALATLRETLDALGAYDRLVAANGLAGHLWSKQPEIHDLDEAARRLERIVESASRA